MAERTIPRPRLLLSFDANPRRVHASMSAQSSHSLSWRAWYGVFLLLGIYINSFLDRTILTLLVGPVRGSGHGGWANMER